MTRSRNFQKKKFRKMCKAVPNGPELQQSMECENEPCDGEDMEEVRSRLNHLDDDDEDEDYGGERADGNGEIIEEWLQVREGSGISELTGQTGMNFLTKLIRETFNNLDMQILLLEISVIVIVKFT